MPTKISDNDERSPPLLRDRQITTWRRGCKVSEKFSFFLKHHMMDGSNQNPDGGKERRNRAQEHDFSRQTKHIVPEGQTRTANADMATPIRPITTLMT